MDNTQVQDAPAQAANVDGYDAPVVPSGKSMEIRNLKAYYGNFLAISDVNMEIQPNRVTALIGPSGCGKSTLIRCLNRMHEVTPGARVEGAVLLDGQNIYAPSTDPVKVRRLVGMVFQKPNPFPTMSIADNVLAGFKLNSGRISHTQAQEIVERSLHQAALWDEVKDKLGKSGASLSGGQQQRLCIARTIAINPEVILMDEPCSALDPIATLKIEELIEELKAQYTIVIVTHNMQQASRASDFTAFMLAQDGPGHLIEFGPTEQIFTRPTQKRTEDYITGRFG